MSKESKPPRVPVATELIVKQNVERSMTAEQRVNSARDTRPVR